MYRLLTFILLFAATAMAAPPDVAPPSRTPQQLFHLLAWEETDEDTRDSARRDDERALYEEATDALDDEDWGEAADLFGEVTSFNGRYADDATYWKAYALHKAGKRRRALTAIIELYDTHPDSRWVKEAKALEAEIREESEGGSSTRDFTSDDDDELKLLIVSNLMHTRPSQGIPVLKRLLEKPESSVKIREQALFVLAQYDTPESRAIIADYARGGASPELQEDAVQYLGIFGGRESKRLLKEIYQTSSDRELKEKILGGFMISGEHEFLLEVAQSEENTDLRRAAVEQLSVMGKPEALWKLYQRERDLGVREQILEGFMISGKPGYLLEIAKTDQSTDLRESAVDQLSIMGQGDALWELYENEPSPKVRENILEGFMIGGDHEHLQMALEAETDPGLREDAISYIGLAGGERAGRILVSLYGSEKDPSTRMDIIEALFIQHNVDALIDIARNETDRKLRAEAIEYLSVMGSDKATEFLLELLDEN